MNYIHFIGKSAQIKVALTMEVVPLVLEYVVLVSNFIINPIRTGRDLFFPPRVNLMASFWGRSKNFQLLMVFQVETSVNLW